jgi:hypothetical protein
VARSQLCSTLWSGSRQSAPRGRERDIPRARNTCWMLLGLSGSGMANGKILNCKLVGSFKECREGVLAILGMVDA